MFTTSILGNWIVLMALGLPACMAYVVTKELHLMYSSWHPILVTFFPILIGVSVAIVWSLVFCKIWNWKVGK